MMDYIEPIYEFKDKLFHIHFKDVKILRHRLNEVGIMAYPLAYMSPKLPGYGNVDWGKFVSALTDVGYEGFACIEVEDRSFEGSIDKVLDSLRISSRYLSQYVI
jgi:sugar phosphate isomerase/epimerase